MNRAIVREIGQVARVKCPCGYSSRVFTASDTGVLSLHRTEFVDAKLHYHSRTTEVYYILEGKGNMVLDGRSEPIRPGLSIMIPPGVRHRIEGSATAIVCAVPAYDPQDEFFPD